MERLSHGLARKSRPQLRDSGFPSPDRTSQIVSTAPNFADDGLFESAFRHAAIGKGLVGLDGRWIKVNPSLCRIVGYTEDELHAVDFRTFVHPDDQETDLSDVTSLAEGGRDSYEIEKRYLHKDRSVVWALLTVSLVRKDDGSPHFLGVQIQDITRRKQAESEREAFFEASPDLLAISGKSKKLEVVNGAWERALGWTREEMTGRPFLEFVHPEDRSATLAEAVAIHAGGRAAIFRNRYLAKDGEYRWLEWNTRLTDGGRLYSVVRDVTSRERDEQAKRWLASLVERSEDAIVGVDTHGMVVSWNASAELLFGYAAFEMRGAPLGLLMPSDRDDEHRNLQQRVQNGESSFELDTVRKRKDGSLIDVHIVAARVDDDLGRPLGWSVTARDITDRKRLIDALGRQVAELRGTKLLLDATFANIQDGVALLDGERQVLLANGAYAEMFGFALEELTGLSRSAFLERAAKLVDDPEAFVAWLMPATADTREASAEFLFRLPRRRFLRRTIKAIQMGGQRLHLVVWHDVTAEKDLIAEREREAMTDALTGISSRRAAEGALAQEIARAERSGVRFSVALFDVDHFKRVNDLHGHLAGDEVLRQVSGVLAAQARKTDIVGRWGGEEFIAILPANLEGADVFCDRVRAAIESIRRPGVGRITVSAGVAEWQPGEAPNALVGRADDLLYSAKRLGRNRVVSASNPSAVPAENATFGG